MLTGWSFVPRRVREFTSQPRAVKSSLVEPGGYRLAANQQLVTKQDLLAIGQCLDPLVKILNAAVVN